MDVKCILSFMYVIVFCVIYYTEDVCHVVSLIYDVCIFHVYFIYPCCMSKFLNVYDSNSLMNDGCML